MERKRRREVEEKEVEEKEVKPAKTLSGPLLWDLSSFFWIVSMFLYKMFHRGWKFCA